jgi:hypothetical protein
MELYWAGNLSKAEAWNCTVGLLTATVRCCSPPHAAAAAVPLGVYPPRAPDTLHNNKDDGATVNNWE